MGRWVFDKTLPRVNSPPEVTLLRCKIAELQLTMLAAWVVNVTGIYKVNAEGR